MRHATEAASAVLLPVQLSQPKRLQQHARSRRRLPSFLNEVECMLWKAWRTVELLRALRHAKWLSLAGRSSLRGGLGESWLPLTTPSSKSCCSRSCCHACVWSSAMQPRHSSSSMQAERQTWWVRQPPQHLGSLLGTWAVCTGSSWSRRYITVQHGSCWACYACTSSACQLARTLPPSTPTSAHTSSTSSAAQMQSSW